MKFTLANMTTLSHRKLSSNNKYQINHIIMDPKKEPEVILQSIPNLYDKQNNYWNVKIFIRMYPKIIVEFYKGTNISMRETLKDQ